MNSRSETFERRVRAGHQNLLLLGMSGVGKSTWRTRIAADPNLLMTGIEIDKRIGRNAQMVAFLLDEEGKDEAEKMGNVFGKPWENPNRYREKENDYLKAEKQEMAILHRQMKANRLNAYVGDLTGSAIYCPEQLKKLRREALSVYLEAGTEQYDEMRENFLRDPKPVCWGEILDDWQTAARDLGGRAIEKLPELYAKLLDTRHKLYQLNADVVVPWEVHREQAKTPADLFEAIKQKLAD